MKKVDDNCLEIINLITQPYMSHESKIRIVELLNEIISICNEHEERIDDIRKTKQLYLVTDVPDFVEEVSCYRYVVKAYDANEAISIAKNNMNEILRKWRWQATLIDNEEVWE